MKFGRVFPANDNFCRLCSAAIVSSPQGLVSTNSRPLFGDFSMLMFDNIDYRPYLEDNVATDADWYCCDSCRNKYKKKGALLISSIASSVALISIPQLNEQAMAYISSELAANVTVHSKNLSFRGNSSMVMLLPPPSRVASAQLRFGC